MANDSIITTKGKNTLLYRGYTANTSLSANEYLVPTKFKVGINNDTPDVTDTDLDLAIPISNGIVNDDGDNTLTGTNGGDNTTDNTTTFKQGGGVTDDTSQNLIANSSSASKTWTISNLATLGIVIDASKFCSIWIYIIDSAALAKFVSSGTALELKLGSDSSNYYSITYTASQLSIGWNLITDSSIVSSWNETGSVGIPIDTFILEATTNNATDTFSSGDVIYDLLRTWSESDLIKSFVSGYPTLDFINNEVKIRCYLNSLEAVGFNINGLGIFNEDNNPLMTSEDTFTADSKSNTDEFAYIIKNRIL